MREGDSVRVTKRKTKKGEAGRGKAFLNAGRRSQHSGVDVCDGCVLSFGRTDGPDAHRSLRCRDYIYKTVP